MKKWLVPGIVLLIGVAALFMMDRYYRGEARKDAFDQQTATMERTKILLHAGLRERKLAVEDLAAFIAVKEKFLDHETFNRYAAAIFENHSAMRALQYVDTGYVIRYVFPLEGNEAAVNLDLMTRPAKPFAIRAQRKHVTTVSDPVVTVQGSYSIVIRSPIYREDEFLGLVQGVVDIESLLAETSKIIAPHFVLSLADEEGRAFWKSGEASGPSLSEPFMRWQLNVAQATDQPLVMDDTLKLLWALGLALLTALLYVVYQSELHKDTLAKAVKTKTSELLASETRFRTFFERAGVGIAVADTETTLFSYVNPSMCKFLGYSQDELLHLSVKEIHPQEHLKELLDDFKAVTEGRKSLTLEAPCLTKSGEIVYADISATSMDIDGKVCSVGFFRDVTSRVRLLKEKETYEAHLRQSQKMESIGTMAGGIAHDFNNLLAIINGNLELLQVKQQAGKSIDQNLEQIKTASNRAKDLVAQILAFSRQEQRELAPVNLTSFVSLSLKFLRPMIPTTVEVVTETSEYPIFINADTTRLQQVLINLCSNAIHAMNEKGVLRISLAEKELTDQEVPLTDGPQAARYVKLTVSDTGQGMDKKTLDRIFDPFFTTKEVGLGTGMGLSVVHGIIEQLGGFIQVNSTPNQGTTFSLYFPVTDDVEAKEEKVTETETVLLTGTESILFVDDEQSVAEASRSMLDHLGYQVTVVTNGREALNLFKTHPDDFDLVITDQTMPKMSGIELAQELLKIRPNMPIILCSGYSAQVTDKDAQEVGIRTFCIKPVAMKQLASVAREALDTSKKPSV